MSRGAALVAAPAGKDEYDARLNAARVVRYLLASHPNEVVTHADVCEALGYEVTPQATCNAIRRLAGGPFGLAIITHYGAGGGHILLAPVAALGKERCRICAHRTPLGVCSLLSRPRFARLVGLNDWCRGWKAWE